MNENEPEESKDITQLEDFERIWAQHVRAEAELDELIDAAAAAEPMTAQATALRAEMIDRARESAEAEERRLGEGRGVAIWSVTEGDRRTVSAELSAALRIPEISMRALIAENRVIMNELPVTRCALTAGRISDRHAQKIIDHALSLPESARDKFERAVIPVAQTQTVAIRPERMLSHTCSSMRSRPRGSVRASGRRSP